jgi:lipopolysaccharide export system protein LptA
VTYREIRAAPRGAPPAERTARSQRLTVETQPGLGAIQRADFRGNVHIEDGATTADGPRAIYRVAEDSFDLQPSPGDLGPPPAVNDGRILVNARTITFALTAKTLHAETNVRSSMQPAKRGAKNAAGRGRGGEPDTKLPSILNQDDPVNVTANRLDYDGDKGTAAYSGDARLFQARTSVKADTIVLDDRHANLDARGHVVTVMFFEETDAKTKETKLVEMDATGDTLFYDDAKRLATYRSGASGRAHIVGTQGDVTADVIELFLKEKGNELERAEADTGVIVKEGIRTGTGKHLTYTTATETYEMTGAPVEIEEKKPTGCSLTVGATVVFKRSTVDTSIKGNGVTPVILKPCVNK